MGSVKKKPYSGEVYAFGTPVMHRMLGPVQGGVIAERWFGGIWIGLQFTSGEHIVALSDGRVIRARAVHPTPETVKMTKEALKNIKVGPWHSSDVITPGTGWRPAILQSCCILIILPVMGGARMPQEGLNGNKKTL